ncbi:Do family serine endopeptidase [Lichenihabitans sp. Uapishka_5]|uniref:Do family serine endopeptidase n=1 Tax=Lichenihabitans sp. Uapishka_5 TaxID=3037302 RepID=UPI0029E8136C|nr:Do family serine endopeptidase [Lichenihabitans sp. Uapishka_5]MDX7952316.1 Do family serine endopeptidase [Lichenihabitans sp. Uapishka_5]
MRIAVRAVVSLLVIGLPALAVQAAGDEPRQVPQSKADVLLSFAPVAKKAQPSVVNVYASRVEKQRHNPLFDDPVFRRFFGDGAGQPRAGGATAQSLGSGVIVDASGLVVTNHHVIEGMNEVKVALGDKREFEATILVDDKRTDLAVLQIKDKGTYPAMEMGDSDLAQVGDIVLAIGNPFGVGQTVTQGIVSALARTTLGGSDYQSFIQTDASINPGNSGGALVDMQARLVGINAAIYSQTGSSVGIGFAIPANLVKIVVAAAKHGAHEVKRPWLGATLQGVTRDIAEGLGLARPAGVLVSDVLDASPAADAGLKQGDVITGLDGQDVDTTDALGYRLSTRPLGGSVPLVVRRDGKALDLSLKLISAPELPARDPVTIHNASPFSGVTAVNLSPAVAEEYSLDRARRGVVVTEVADNTPAAATGFQKGDVILSVNDTRMADTRALQKAVTDRSADYFRLTLIRGGQVVETEVGG